MKTESGAYGIVEFHNDEYVVKNFRRTGIIINTYLKELYILKLMSDSEYIVDYKDHSYKDANIRLERMDQDLFDFMKIFNLQEKYIVDILFNISMGVYHLNSRGVIHGDIKPENILINNDLTVKLCDFGLSHNTNMDTITTRQTLGYQAPEVLVNFEDKSKIDVYSTALVFYNHIVISDITDQSDVLFDHILRYCNMNESDSITEDDLLYYISYESNYDDSDDDAEYIFMHNSEEIKTGIKYSNFLESINATNNVLSRINSEYCARRELLNNGCSEEFADLLQNMLIFIPNQRFSPLEVLHHRIFRDKHVVDLDEKDKSIIIYKPNIDILDRTECIYLLLKIIRKLTISFDEIISILINSVYLFDRYLTVNLEQKKNIRYIMKCCLIISLNIITSTGVTNIDDMDYDYFIDKITKSVNYDLYINDEVFNMMYSSYSEYICNICSNSYYEMDSVSIFQQNDINLDRRIYLILQDLYII